MKTLTLSILTAFTFWLAPKAGLSQTPLISFGDAESFAVLAATTVTNTGATYVSCNVGVSPGSSVTGFDLPVTVDGTITAGQVHREVYSMAGLAQVRAHFLYSELAARMDAPIVDLTGKGLGYADGVMTLTPGIYTFSSAALLKDTLTLDDTGDSNAVFIIKIGSTLTTASYSKVKMKSGGKGANVFWLIGSSATIGTYTQFCGNIIAVTSITMTTGCTTPGKLFALGAAVTMDTNRVLSDYCTGSGFVLLPVKNILLSAICKNQHALLTWSTTSETNNNYFTIEKSNNGTRWVSAGVIKGAGNSSTLTSYTFTDAVSTEAITYYRLKLTDFNGNNTYYNIVPFKKCGGESVSGVTVYPNPSSGKYNLSYAGDKINVKAMEVYNVRGEKVYGAVGFQSSLDLGGMGNGVYYVRIHLNSSITINSTVVKRD